MKYLPLSLFFTLALIFNLSTIIAICLDGQININTASAEELDGLTGIGPVKAQAIISSRPFLVVDDLINVKGIGEATLGKIKTQGLACVEKNSQVQNNSEVKTNAGENNASGTQTTQATSYENYSSKEPKQNAVSASDKTVEFQQTGKATAEPETIKLDSKDIKTNAKSISNTKKYAAYGFIAFAVFLALLFVLRRNNSNDEIV